MSNYYIYCYLDPRKPGKFSFSGFSLLYEPFYIGKGKGQRWQRHFCPSVQNSPRENKHKRYKIEKIQRELGRNPYVIKLFENLSESESHDIEKKLICELGRVDLKTGTLVNLTDGGEGMSGNRMTDSTKKKLSLAHLGMVASRETRKKMSETRSGLRHSDEVLLRMKQKHRDPTKPPKYYLKNTETGEEFFVPNLTDFCENHSFKRTSINALVCGKLSIYAGKWIGKKL